MSHANPTSSISSTEIPELLRTSPTPTMIYLSSIEEGMPGEVLECCAVDETQNAVFAVSLFHDESSRWIDAEDFWRRYWFELAGTERVHNISKTEWLYRHHHLHQRVDEDTDEEFFVVTDLATGRTMTMFYSLAEVVQVIDQRFSGDFADIMMLASALVRKETDSP